MTFDLTAKGFSLVNAKECARYAAMAYDEVPTLVAKSTDTQVLIRQLSVAANSPIVVAFRGTTNIPDFVTDGDFRLAFTPWGEMHSGIWRAWQSIQVDLLNTLLLFANRPIIVLGHSLGGGLAIPCARFLAARGFEVHSVYTFGAPRVGDKQFCVGYDSALFNRTFNVTHQNDPVPLLPPLLMDYRDCGNEAFIFTAFGPGHGLTLNPFYGFEFIRDLLGVFDSWRRGRLALLPNHALSNYRASLEAVRDEDVGDCDQEAAPEETTTQTP